MHSFGHLHLVRLFANPLRYRLLSYPTFTENPFLFLVHSNDDTCAGAVSGDWVSGDLGMPRLTGLGQTSVAGNTPFSLQVHGVNLPSTPSLRQSTADRQRIKIVAATDNCFDGTRNILKRCT